MTPAFAAIVNLIVSLAGAACYLLVGWLWSASTWRRSFDLGWLVVAFILGRYASRRSEVDKLTARDYLAVCLPALPGFALEWLADRGLHEFALQNAFGALARFGVFSCCLLVFVIALTASLRFGVGLDALSTKDEATWRSTIRIGALVVGVTVVAGTAFTLFMAAHGSAVHLRILKSWLYLASLGVYFLLTLKIMLPLILTRVRRVLDERNRPDMHV